MAWANVSHNTLKGHLKHLTRVGLVKVHYVRGDNTGAEYEILTPEEAPPTTHQPPTSHPPTSSQNLVPPTTQNLVLGGGGQVVESQRHNISGNTSFKTKDENTDDEALAGLRRAMREKTGREVSREAMSELDELLMKEFLMAAGRTEIVSNPVAFFAEHLRRRLWKKDKRQIEADVVDKREERVLKVSASKCPDCFGTGMWYPDGYEKGVARCRHEKLTSEGEK